MERLRFNGPRWTPPGHHHRLTYYGEIFVVGLSGRFMVWHCGCGGRWSITRRGYQRLLRGEITLR